MVSDRVALINKAVLKVVRSSNPTNRGQVQHDLRSTTLADHENCLFSSRVVTSASLSKPRTKCQLQRLWNLPKPRPKVECVFHHNSHPLNGSINLIHALSIHSLSDEPPAVAASGAIRALRRSQKTSNSKIGHNRKSAIQN